MNKKRPYVIVNAAMSLDGKLDTIERRGTTISSKTDKLRVDKLRARVDAVLVGGNTLLDEDPKLTVRSAELRASRANAGLNENPAKIGLVSVAHIDPNGDFMTAGDGQRFIFTTEKTQPEVMKSLRAKGAQVFTSHAERYDISGMLSILTEHGIQTLMVEGGGTILYEFFRLQLVDEIWVYIAPKIFGGANAPTLADGPGSSAADSLRLELVSVSAFDNDGGILVHYRIL